MSNLEDLVPPLELCKRIPEGCFADSALVWNEGFVKGNFVIEQRGFGMHYIAPAPTLQEILLAIDEAGGVCPECYYLKNTWKIDCRDKLFNYEELIEAEDEYNPATAALKLWLKLNEGNGQDKQEKDGE